MGHYFLDTQYCFVNRLTIVAIGHEEMLAYGNRLRFNYAQCTCKVECESMTSLNLGLWGQVSLLLAQPPALAPFH